MAMRALLLSALFLLGPRPSSAQEAVRLSGLDEEVEILRDRWGVAHIYAKTEHDLFFAQGFVAARDRLFQLELWRRQATGTVAEILGPRELDRDIGARLTQFRGNLTQELSHYHPRGEAIVRAFVDGVNAYVSETERNPTLLPVEFSLLGVKPGRFTPEVVISRHQGLLGNVTQELDYGMAVHVVGPDPVKDFSWFRPGEPVLSLDPAIDGGLLSRDVLRLYRAFREPIRFRPEDVDAKRRADGKGLEALTSERDLERSGVDVGSNNWVVSGKRSFTGYPLMANDPHRAQQTPSLRYWVHLVGPGWNVIGGGEPAIPGVSIGHNDFGAWGLTVFGQDSEDLYVYETNPANANQYRYRDRWEDMRVVKEAIPVRGEASRTVDLKFTRHGPVFHEDATHHKAYALRAAWMDVGGAPYLASLRMDQARSWEEFREACSYSRIPAENMVWADRAKNIGYQAVGVSPIRPNWSGLVPVPGDGRYEWDGYLPIKALPSVVNPEAGYFGTANNYTVPDDYAYPDALHFTWGDEMRGARVNELLSTGARMSVVDMMRFQHDELSIPARSLVPLLRAIRFETVDLQKAQSEILRWDYVLDRDSVPAAIYALFERRLQENVRDLLVPEKVRTLLGRVNLKRTIDFLAAPDGRFGSDPVAGRDSLLARSFSEAVSELSKRLGPDMAGWRYGQPKLKHALIRHPLGPAVNEELRGKLDVGPLPRGGNASTVNSTGGDDNQTSGASFRIVADTENWDASVGTSAPGQSGNPDSPHYRDLFELWARGKYFPVFFSRAKVESVTEEKVRLLPGRASTSPPDDVT